VRKDILTNFSWLLFDRAIRALLGLAVSVLVARYLGPDDFGQLSFAIAFVYFFSFLVDLGLQQIFVRELKDNPDIATRLVSTTFVLKLAGALAGVVFTALASLFVDDMDGRVKVMILILASGFLFQSLNVIDYLFQARLLSRYMVLARNLAFLIASVVKVYLVLNRHDVVTFAAAGTLELALTAIFMLLAFIFRGEKISISEFDFGLARKTLQASWPLALSLLLISVHMRVDQVMLGILMSSQEVGWYGIAIRFTEFWFLIPTAMVSTLMPYFVELRQENPERYQAQLIKLYSTMFWFGAILSMTVMAIGEPLLVRLVGPAFRPSVTALMITIWSTIFVSQGMARGIWLVSEDLQKYRLYNNGFAVVLNIMGNLLLIPRLGIVGAALSTLLTQGLTLWGFSLVWTPLRTSTLALMRASNPRHLLRSTGP